MPYTLGAITLPRPTNFTRHPIDVSVRHITIDGKSKEDTTNLKEEFILEYRFLTQAQVAAIIGERDLKTERAFAVSDGSLTIASTGVLIKITDRMYLTAGSEYREHLKLILTEVE